MKTHQPAGDRIARATLVSAAALIAILNNLGCSGAGGASTTTITTPTPLSPSISVAITPSSTTLPPGGSTKFVAGVAGTTNTAVTWAVQEANAGTITSDGIYTAPKTITANPSTFHVIAISQADPSKQSTGTVVVSLTAPVSADVAPNSANVPVNGTLGFQTTGFDKSVAWTWYWSIKEGSAGGAIVPNTNDPSRAAYIAPASPGTFHVVLHAATVDTDPYGDPWFEVDAGATVTVLSEPKPGTFVLTGSMATRRFGFTSTLLHDGRVLIAGGDNTTVAPDSPPSPSTAEIYDPATGAFTATGNLTTSRYGHAAVPLPDGRVLLAGGNVCVGTTRCTVSALVSAEIYDPANGTFTATANMLLAHPCLNGMPLPNGKALFLGGRPDTLTAEIYDPGTQTFVVANATNSRESFECPQAILLANGKVLIAPNPAYYGPPAQSQVEIFDPATGQYTLISPDFGAGKTDIAGGTTLTLLNSGLVLFAGLEGTVCSSGGCDVTSFDPTTWLFNPSNGSVQPTGALPTAKVLFSHTLLQDGTVLLTGGLGDGVEATAEIYDPKSGTFSSISNMNIARYLQTATLLNDGRVLIVGGVLAGNENGASAELYYPAGTSLPATHAGRH